MKQKVRRIACFSAAVAVSLGFAACANNATNVADVVETEVDVVEVTPAAPTPTETEEGEAAATPAETPVGATGTGNIDCSKYEQFGDLSGTTVYMYAPTVDTEYDLWDQSFGPFEECTGATVDLEGSREFEAQLLVRLQAGNAPDIAMMPQPGLLETVVRDFPNSVVAAPTQTVANVDQYWAPAWKDFGTVDGTFYAAPLGANMKSLVWYSPAAFAEAGYEVPQTWTEMMALTQQAAQDRGGPVWCVGVEGGDATGWPGTDWVEDTMLRTAGVEKYRDWYEHNIPFNDPSVVTAFDTAGTILKNDEYVNAGLGDSRSIATTSWSDAGFGLLDGSCLLHRQQSQYPNSLPPGTTVGPDGDIYAFYLPTDQTDIRPVLVGGDFALAFSDRPEVQAFQTYVSSPEFANYRADITTGGGWVSANTGLDPNVLDSPVDRLAAETFADPHAVAAFDASDMMPGPVGAGTFWTGIVDWLTGSSTQEVVDRIEASWPTH